MRHLWAGERRRRVRARIFQVGGAPGDLLALSLHRQQHGGAWPLGRLRLWMAPQGGARGHSQLPALSLAAGVLASFDLFGCIGVQVINDFCGPDRSEARKAACAEPNCKYQVVKANGWPYVFVMATRPIAAGEALRADYGDAFWETVRTPIKIKGGNLLQIFLTRSTFVVAWFAANGQFLVA